MSKAEDHTMGEESCTDQEIAAYDYAASSEAHNTAYHKAYHHSYVEEFLKSFDHQEADAAGLLAATDAVGERADLDLSVKEEVGSNEAVVTAREQYDAAVARLAIQEGSFQRAVDKNLDVSDKDGLETLAGVNLKEARQDVLDAERNYTLAIARAHAILADRLGDLEAALAAPHEAATAEGGACDADDDEGEAVAAAHDSSSGAHVEVTGDVPTSASSSGE